MEREQAQVTDQQVMAAFETGDPALGGLIYDHLIHSVDATILRVMGRREQDHDDLVQIAFEQIIGTLANHRFAGACSLRSWASSITCHVALNAIRSRRTQRRYFDLQVDTQAPEFPGRSTNDTEREVSVRSELERVRRHLAGMNQARAEVVVLHDVLGHELTEIAVLLGASVAAVQSRLVRGRKELHERMDAEKEGGA